MKGALASPPGGSEEAFSHSIHGVRRITAAFYAAVLLALAFPLVLVAQTNCVPPSIESQPQSEAVVPGADTAFSVTAAGSALTYQWMENNSPLPGQTNSTLVLTQVSTNSAAQYSVILSNACGVVTSRLAILTVLSAPPTIAVQPQNQSVWSGNPVTFSVGATGGGARGNLPTIASGTLELWLRADSVLVAGTNAQVSQWQDQSGNGNNASQTNTNQQPFVVYPPGIGGMPAIRFSGVQNSSQSEFLYGAGTVAVPNALTAFMLYEMNSGTIGEQMPLFIGIPGIGINASFGNYIPSGDMAVSTWTSEYYNSGYIIPTNTYRIWTDRLNTNENLLQFFDDTPGTTTNISLVTSGHNIPGAGFYVGGLNSALQWVGSSRNFGGDIAEVIVYQGQLSDVDRLAVVNYLKQRYYQINGPGLSFQWLFNGTNLAGATNAYLTFSNSQSAEAGTYSVVASNVFGAVTSSNAVLEVNLIPIILTQPTNQLIIPNQPAAFSVLAQGPMPLQYQWTFDGTNITGATNSTLVFSNALVSEAGTYAVIVGTEPSVIVSSNAMLSLFPSNEIVSNLNAGQLNTALQAGGTVTFAIDGTIVLTNTITISNNVALDGAGHSITISGGGAVQLFNLPAGFNLTLRNLTLANAVDHGWPYDIVFTYPAIAYGGAIFTQGNLVIEKCTFTNNSAQAGDNWWANRGSPGFSAMGGAIYNTGGLTITNSLFMSNSVVGGHQAFAGAYSPAGSGLGGAIYNGGGTVELDGVIFSNNTVIGASPPGNYVNNYGGTGGNACGGALYSSGGAIFAANLQAIDNSASSEGRQSYNYSDGTPGAASGGAIGIAGGTATISNSVFSQNAALGGTIANGTAGGAGGVSHGGGLFNSGSTLLFECIMTGNSATGGGNTFFGPAGGGEGGAVYNSGSIQVFGSTISVNSAIGGGYENYYGGGGPADGQGGAIYNGGSAQFFSSTISGNIGAGGRSVTGGGTTFANGWGGAIANAGLVQLSNTLLSNNATTGASSFGEAVYNTGALLTDTDTFVAPNSLGTPPLEYDWQINGTNIAGAITSTFNLTNVQFNNSATYGLLISNATGLVTNFDEILNLPLTNAPSFVLQPASQVVDMGTTVNMEVAAVGFPAPTYQWLFDGTNVLGATSSLFVLSNTQQYQAGTYTVIATNFSGSSTSQPAVLTVEGPVLLAGINLGNAGFSVSGAGIAGNYIIETSTNLVNWWSLRTNFSPFTFVDTNAASSPFRFYRTVLVH